MSIGDDFEGGMITGVLFMLGLVVVIGGIGVTIFLWRAHPAAVLMIWAPVIFGVGNVALQALRRKNENSSA